MLNKKQMKKVTRNLLLATIFSVFGLNCTKRNDSIKGNWKSIESNVEIKIHTEVYIDDETFNVFSEEINDIVFSNYYVINHERIFILENKKSDTIVELAYEIKGNSLKLSGERLSSKYSRINNENTLDEYINDSISKLQYLESFYQRKNQND